MTKWEKGTAVAEKIIQIAEEIQKAKSEPVIV